LTSRRRGGSCFAKRAASNARSAMLAFAALSGIACSRTRDVPLTEVPQLAAAVAQGRTARVRAMNGETVEIDSFSRLKILREGPCWESGCATRTILVMDQPLRARLLPHGLELSGRIPRKPEGVRLVELGRQRTWAQVSEHSTSRGWIIGGVAASSALLVGLGVAALVGLQGNDPHGLALVAGGASAGVAAGGVSLLFTFPATSELGRTVDDK
jgi:hypothetical protein